MIERFLTESEIRQTEDLIINNNICKTIHKNKLPKRGMLIWHSTGSGKTCTATSIMDGFWGTKQKIIY